MSNENVTSEAGPVLAARPKALRHIFTTGGKQVTLDKVYKKEWKDALTFLHGSITTDKFTYTALDLNDPIGGALLVPCEQSPICQACGLFEHKAEHPFMDYSGSNNPLVTFVFDSISAKEDEHGSLASDGPADYFKKFVIAHENETGLSVKDVRFVALTRCANRIKKAVNYKTKGQHCKLFFLQDLAQHMPKVIIPVGSAALGLLCHKSNAQNWSGRLLTWRGWPDDWLVNPAFVKPRELRMAKTERITVLGHPIMGRPPTVDSRCLLYPMQSPRLIFMLQSKPVADRWREQLKTGLRLAIQNVVPRQYILPHYQILTDVEAVKSALLRIINYPGLLASYDTETEGLHPFMGQKVVFMMFRYRDPDTGDPIAFGFPWDYGEGPQQSPASPLRAYIEELRPYVQLALISSVVVGHNTSFDALFTHKALAQADEDQPLNDALEIRDEWREAQARLNALADAFVYDTWHMAYTRRQERGSLGLDSIAYDFVPDLAGYEEDFTLLIKLEPELLDPEYGGHYARCPQDKWDSHLKPYVMGDVEVCYRAREELQAKLDNPKKYRIPMAHPQHRGMFKYFSPPDRGWLYKNIMSPAARLLTKMMGRGMKIDEKELANLEDLMPKAITGKINEMKGDKGGVVKAFIQQHIATDKNKDDPEKRWEFDIEKKDQMRELLFERMQMPIQRLTKAGRKFYGEEADEWDFRIGEAIQASDPEIGEKALRKLIWEQKLEYAALDKFTLNKLVVDHEEVRPLLEYRKVHKLYSTYVRPLRNMQFEGIDKKARTKMQHLCPDGCLHAQFLLAGTRSGRLSSRNPNLQQLPKESVKHESVELQVKRMYTSRFGSVGCLYGADFSQIELRLLAAISGDESMVEAYAKGTDLHTLTTSRIFNLDYDTFSKDHMQWLEKNGRTQEAKELRLKRDIGKCVDPTTLISVNGRVTRVGSLHSGREPGVFYPVTGFKVQGPDGPVDLHNFYSDGIAERVLVCTRKGLVVSSKNHRFMLSDGTLVRAADLKKNDVLVPVQPLKAAEDTNVVRPFNPYGKEPASLNFRVHVDEDMAYVLGLFYGDGYSSSVEVAIVAGGQADYFWWQDIIADSLRRVGFETRINRTIWNDEETGSAYGTVTFGSVRVSDTLLQLGAVTQDRKRSLQIPEWLFNASYELKMSFLAGLMDTDGTASKTGGLSVTTKSWVLAQDVMVMLRGMNIACSFDPCWNKTYKKYYYRVNVAVRHAWQHFRGVMRHTEKRERLRKPTFCYKEEWPNAVMAIIPIEPGPVVDLEVASAEHLYLVNGLTSHNTTNFLSGYGGGSFGLQTVLAGKQIYRSQEECARIIDAFFGAYPAVKELLAYYKRFIADSEVAVSVFGRVRYFDEAQSNDKELQSKALRAGCNHLIQATASDMMLICLVVIEQMMREAQLDSLLVSTVHDSLVIDALRVELPRIDEIVNMVLNNMPEVFKMQFGEAYNTSWMSVKFTGDCDVGHNYGAMRAIGDNPDWDNLLASN